MDSSWQGGGWEKVASFDYKVDKTCPGTELYANKVQYHLSGQSVTICLVNHGAPQVANAEFTVTSKYYSEILVRIEGYSNDVGRGFGCQQQRGNVNKYHYLDGFILAVNNTKTNYIMPLYNVANTHVSNTAKYACFYASVDNYLSLPPDGLGYDTHCIRLKTAFTRIEFDFDLSNSHTYGNPHTQGCYDG